jgi:predicted nucleic acid-binding protein
VVDASVALAWVLDDETDTYADSILSSLSGSSILVPSHWALEVTNALLMAERRRRTTPADTSRAVALLGALPIEIDHRTGEVAPVSTLSIARSYALTVYDAAYLELCVREGLPLATIDTRLASAIVSAGGKIT